MSNEKLERQGAQEEPESAKLQEEAKEPVLSGLPPELGELEGKDVKTALAEVAKLKKSYEEAQKLIGRQGQELGYYRQIFSQMSQQGVPPIPVQPPVQPQAQTGVTEEEDLETVEGLWKTVKKMKEEVGRLAQEKQALHAYIQAQEVKQSVLSQLPDAHQYSDYIRLLSANVKDPRILTNPDSWKVIYLWAKALKEAERDKLFAPFSPQLEAPTPPAPQASQPQAIPAGEAGLQVPAKSGPKIPSDLQAYISRLAKIGGLSEEKVREILKE